MRKQVQVVKKLQASAALAALAFSLGTVTAAGAWADTAVSGAVNGGSAQAAQAGGPGKSKAGYGGAAVASTKANPHSAQADAASVAASGASQKSHHSSSQVSGIATADAHAKAHGRTLEASAEATVAISGKAKQPGGAVTAGTVGHSKATAISKPTGSSAVAESDSGGYAAAVTGSSGYRVASVTDGVVVDGKHGPQRYEIAYDSQGDFSIAITKGLTAQAFTGSTSDVGALASGDLRVILSSGTFAGAYAGPYSAAAFAGAYYGGFAQTAGGFASVDGAAFAYAAVTHVPFVETVSCSFNYPLQAHLKQKCRWPQPED